MVTVKAGSGWTDMGQYASAFGKGLNYHYFIFSKGGFTEGLLQAQDRGEVSYFAASSGIPKVAASNEKTSGEARLNAAENGKD